MPDRDDRARYHRISTHSLTKRLTLLDRAKELGVKNFNSQPHEEADDMKGVFLWQNLHFNSQPHEEADHF